MATGGPKAPSVESLEKLVAQLDEVINKGNDLAVVGNGNGETEVLEIIKESDVVQLRDALEWMQVFLENRRDYHKRRNVKTKVEMALFKEKLQSAGVDVAKLERDAAKAADDSIT